MSSALDEDTQQTLAEGRETAGAMLRAAQKDLQKVFIVFLVGFLGTFYALRLYIWDFFKRVTRARMSELTGQQVTIIAQTPFDVILLQAKIGLVAGIIIAIPVFLYFSRDALKARDLWPQTPVPRWKLAAILALSTVLFVLGMAYGYFVFFPFMFQFLATNALSAGFHPNWSIVLWAQFIFLLTMSFGLAAQMPLVVTGLSYTGIVPYEFFREKWRHAVVLIFVFGAVFSPPDPFTQIMWAIPLLFLYGFSLYLAKVVVTARRGSERIDLLATALANWNRLAGLFALGVGGAYIFYLRGGVGVANGILSWMGSRYRAVPAGEITGLSPTADALVVGVVAGVVFLLAGLMYFAYQEIEGVVGPDATPGVPADLDLAELDAAGIRAAPAEAFADLAEPEALELAQDAMDDGDHEKAQAVLDRFDEATEGREPPEEEGEEATTVSGGPGGGAGGVAGDATAMFGPASVTEAVRRGAERVNWRRRADEQWNLLVGVAVVLFGVGYAVTARPATVESFLATLGFAGVSVPDVPGALGVGETLALVVVAVAALLATAVVAGLFAAYVAYTAGTDPTAVDVDALSTDELRRAPRATFAALTEPAANYLADRALQRGDRDRAQLIYDRFDEAQSPPEAAGEGSGAGDGAGAAEGAAAAGEADATAEGEGPAPGTFRDRAQRAGGTFLEDFADDEDAEDDIGGYYTDLRFILDSLTSRTFRIVGWFMLVLASVFAWLYTGGIGRVYEGFLAQVPGQVTPDTATVIALHPVEALIFEVKFSALIAALATLPLIGWYSWPALRERGFVRGRRQVIFGWLAALLAGLLGGFAVGYLYVAPAIISYLVYDAIQANMVISYRITDFFWLIFFTTAGIGLLADVPVLMVLLNHAGVSYQAMRSRWREVTVGIMLFAALFTPADVITMFLVTIPLMAAYGVGLGVLFVITLGGRRNLREPRVVEGG